jgi:5-methylcytosine-specific restriction endonuclease McrA
LNSLICGDTLKQTLVLNATYEVMRVVSWKRAIVLFFNDKVDILDEYDDYILTPSLNMKVPAVVRHKKLIKSKYKIMRFTKSNVFARDNFTCQYCNRKLLKSRISLDHILPKSRGGLSTWNNCVAACIECNMKKGNKTPKEANMKLYKEPYQPNQAETFMLSIKYNVEAPDIWKNYALPVV